MEEAKKFILKKLDECSLFVNDDYPESIFHIWDKQALRQKKLLRLSDKSCIIDFKPNKNSVILFEQDYKNGYFWFNHYKIYKILIDEYCLNTNQINELMNGILKDDNKMKSLTTTTMRTSTTYLNDDNKMKSLTTVMKFSIQRSILKDDNKMKSLTPINTTLLYDHNHNLEVDNKMKSLTHSEKSSEKSSEKEDDNKIKNLIPIGELPSGIPDLIDTNKMRLLNSNQEYKLIQKI